MLKMGTSDDLWIVTIALKLSMPGHSNPILRNLSGHAVRNNSRPMMICCT